MKFFEYNFWGRMIAFILRDIVIDVLRVPFWWYTEGLVTTSRVLIRSFWETERRLAFRVWLRNLFTPMYGMYDWQSRIISFVMRAVLMVWKLFYLAVWSAILLAACAVWIAMPPLIAWGIFHSLTIYTFGNGN